jgi:acetyl esterase/lipase
VRWTRRRAPDLGIDPDRIVALGQSSGAYLAALLGTLPDPADPDLGSSRVQAVVSFYGPTDLPRLARTRHLHHDPTRILLGRPPADFPLPATDPSPIQHVTSDAAPMLLIHGTEDLWVPIEQSERMAEALRRVGVMHRLRIVPGARHGFEALGEDPGEKEKNRGLPSEILAFLQSVWNVGSE